jgi:hypothetical protein
MADENPRVKARYVDLLGAYASRQQYGLTAAGGYDYVT